MNITPTIWSRKKRTRHVKNRPDQTRTGHVSPRSTQRAPTAWLARQKGGKSGDRKTLRVCPTSLESAFCWSLSAPSFLGTCSGTCSGTCRSTCFGQLFGHLASSVAPITPLGPTTYNTLQWTNFQYAQDRTGSEHRQKQKQRDIRQERRSDNRQKYKIFTNLQNTVHGTNTPCLLLSAVLLQISGGLFSVKARRGTILSYVIDTETGHA